MADSIHYLSSGVATGKSHAAAKYINDNNDLTLIVVPTLAMVSQWKKEIAPGTDMIVVTSEDDSKSGAGHSVMAVEHANLNVVQRIGSVIGNRNNIGKKIVMITTHASFMCHPPEGGMHHEWNVIFDECPPVYSQVCIATRDKQNDAWAKTHIEFTKTTVLTPREEHGTTIFEEKEGLYKLALAPGNVIRDSAITLVGGRNSEDSRKRKVLAPLIHSHFYDVFSRHDGYVYSHKAVLPTLKEKIAKKKLKLEEQAAGIVKNIPKEEKDIYFDCYVRPSAEFFSPWKSITVLAADLMEKDFYLYLQNTFKFEEHAGMKAFQDEGRLNRDYSNVEIHYISDKTSALSKSDFSKDDGLIEKINTAVKEIVGEDEFIYTQNNKSAFLLNTKLYENDQAHKVSSSSHGINKEEWTNCNTAVFMSALNDSAITSKVKRQMFTVTNAQLRDSLVSSSAYQTVGRCSIRTDNYADNKIKFVVFDKYQAQFLQTKFKNSKIINPINPVIVEYKHKPSSYGRYKDLVALENENEYIRCANAVMEKFGIELSRDAYFNKRKEKWEYKAKEILLRNIATKEQVVVSEITNRSKKEKSNAALYFFAYPHEFLNVDNIIP